MNITIDQLLAKIGQQTILLEGAQARIRELERQLSERADVQDQQHDQGHHGGQENPGDHRAHDGSPLP